MKKISKLNKESGSNGILRFKGNYTALKKLHQDSKEWEKSKSKNVS